ncbi:MAG: DUF2341 domain-containing protein [Candidatus Andersenbacteria bacterium]|nr:DUF2341 domain-containing protein [Candidatus Andersenbacteria bacterium]
MLGTLPLPVQAVSSTTYTFTKTESKKYDITGPVTFASGYARTDWYDANWQYRQKITVNHEQVAGALSAFPMLVKISGEIFQKAQADGDDILFTEDDGKTKLYHEIEQFDGELVAWVLVPELSVTEDTILYVYYGNPKAENQQSPTRVWDSNMYAGVWHFDDDMGVQQRDATLNDNVATPTGFDAVAGKAVGRINTAVDFNQRNYLLVSRNSQLNSVVDASAYTWSMWVKTASTSGSSLKIFAFFDGSSGAHTGEFHVGGSGGGRVRYSSGAFQSLNSEATVNDNQWHYLVFMRRDSNIETYIDGVLDAAASGVRTAGAPNPDGNLFIGKRDAGTGVNGFPGTIDELRLISTARSGDWIATEYNN